MMALGIHATAGTPLWGQVSPGPLARAHRDLEGTLKCTSCHGRGREAMSGRCESCHKEIGWLRQQRRGYHASREANGTPCAACHPDHAGLDFNLLRWPEGTPDRFDHRRTGWPLEKKHAEAKCSDCHQSKHQLSPAAQLSVRKTGQGYTGLETTCASCHEDIHRGALGTKCTQCHDSGDWTITPGFGHDTTGYPLTGKHAAVECDKCHLAVRLAPKGDGRGHQVPIYKPVPHQACTDCHEDVHKGQFGPTCSSCHSTRGFQVIDRGAFNHDKTRYSLTGQHASLRCAACHRDFSTPLARKPAFQSCTACHKDAHNGTATLAGKVVDCAGCHTVNGFVPATFTVAQHANTKYPLEGKHAATRCADCHARDASAMSATKWGSAKVVLRPAFMKCLNCHSDDHGGQLSARTDRGNCAACHRMTGWTPSTFDSASHGTLKLVLDGRHAAVECRACHGVDRKGLPPLGTRQALGKAGFLFKVAEVECAACHVDPHSGRFTGTGPRAKPKGCLACHDTRAFRPSTAGIAGHQQFGFPLEGAHRATPCLACHAEMEERPQVQKPPNLIRAGGRFVERRFETRTACADCHETPHGEQFADRKDQGRCDACHTAEAFRPAGRFDHDRDATFSLKGAHERVPCSGCHLADLNGGNRGRLIFRPLSGKCESCHGGKELR